MKKLIFLIFASLIMASCQQKETRWVNGYKIIVVDSCEYLQDNRGYGAFNHKGDCRFCKERRQKEMEELLKQLRNGTIH